MNGRTRLRCVDFLCNGDCVKFICVEALSLQAVYQCFYLKWTRISRSESQHKYRKIAKMPTETVEYVLTNTTANLVTLVY